MSEKALSADGLAAEDAGRRGVEGTMAAARGWDLFPNAAAATVHPKEAVEGDGLFKYEEDLYCAPAFMNIFEER
jgi:hypothetical protein